MLEMYLLSYCAPVCLHGNGNFPFSLTLVLLSHYQWEWLCSVSSAGLLIYNDGSIVLLVVAWMLVHQVMQ